MFQWFKAWYAAWLEDESIPPEGIEEMWWWAIK